MKKYVDENMIYEEEKEKLFYSILEGNKIVSFLTDEIHTKEMISEAIKDGYLLINEELWQYLLGLGQVEFNGIIEERTYTLEDKGLFSKVVIPPIDLGVQPPTDSERIQAIEEMIKELI